jgi:hypothetical protein
MPRIKGQGTALKIETGSGGAKTITGATAAYPVVITSAAHGLSAGDRVTIAAVGGMTELNGNTYTIEYVTTNTFALKGIDGSAYSAYASDGTATPVTLTTVGRTKTANVGGGESSELDGTELASTAKEYEGGLADYGEATAEVNVDYTDAGQNAVRARYADQVSVDFQVVYSDGTVAAFTGFVKRYEENTGVDAFVTAPITIRKTGATTWT